MRADEKLVEVKHKKMEGYVSINSHVLYTLLGVAC